jgi:endonuclease-3
LRLALTKAKEPEQIEGDLQNLRPRDDWTAFSMRLILHGRQICHARAPRCGGCSLRDDCPRIGVSSSNPILEHGG